MVRGLPSRLRPRALFFAVTAFAVLVSGCAVVAKAVGTIVMRIGTEIVVDAGADYIRKIFSSDDAKGDATFLVSHTNATGDSVGVNYAIDGAKGITIRNVKGEIHLVGDGHGLVVTVAAGSTATIEITFTNDGSRGQVAADPEDQAVTIDGIIRWSGRSRDALRDALNDLGACRNVPAATAALRGVADGRAHQIDALDRLDVSALSGGESIRSTLVQALRYSLDADHAFVRWGENVIRPECRHDANYDEAMSHSRNATATKKRFVGVWNPVARTYGLPEYQDFQI